MLTLTVVKFDLFIVLIAEEMDPVKLYNQLSCLASASSAASLAI